MLKSANGVQMFGDVARRKRYFYALLMILLMIGAAELLMEREIIFPEMAALTIGMWIVDKRVWRVSRIGVVVLMTLGAIAGVCIVRYSPFPLLANLMFAFAFAAICLTLSRATLVPQISACMLPVLLETESWVYPVAVFIMSVIVVGGQWGMERMGLREKITYTSVSDKLEGGFGTVGVFIDDGGSGCITSCLHGEFVFYSSPVNRDLRGVCQFKSRIS